jgi:WD40 repeat protein
MIARALAAAALLLLAACGSAPPGARGESGATLAAIPAGRFVHHQGEAREMAWLDGGRIFVGAGTDGRIEFLAGNGRVVRTLLHPDGVSALALSPDGTLLASGGYDRTIRIWRVADGAAVRVLSGSGGTVWTLGWSPDGAAIASGGEDKLVRLWRVADGAQLRTIAGHELNIWAVRFSPDGRRIASASFDHSIRLWDAATGRLVRRLAGHDQAAVCLAFSPDGRLLASGGDDSTVRLWRVADGARLATLTGGTSHVYAVAFSPDGRWLASGGRARGGFGTFWHQLTGFGAYGPAVRLWRVADGALQATLDQTDDVMALAFTPDGRRLAAASTDGSNAFWRLNPR